MIFLALLLAVGPAHADCKIAPGPVYKHSHNDYTRDHPLKDALAHDFDSIEADVHLKDGQLLVCHDGGDCRKENTLEAMYLAPLQKLFRTGNGWVRPYKKQLTLLIEFKTDGDSTYRAVLPLLQRYRSMLTVVDKGQVKPGAITVVITGHVPRSLIQQAQPRLMAIDGGKDDRDSAAPASLVPWVSFDWGDRPGSPEDLACRARQHHRLLRFWGGSDDEFQWAQICKAGVDIVSTNHLTRFDRFLPACRKLRR